MYFPFMCLLSEFRVVMARYDFRIKTIFGSSLSPVVCRWAPVVYKGEEDSCFIVVVCVCLRIVASNTYFCFSSSCVPCVAGFSELSILG
jgi:hypothetical protein